MSCCHQCRNSSVRPKMSCSNKIQGRSCGKLYCNRCILYRYPDITFDEHNTDFVCPVCSKTCNCSACSRSRGEEFVSMRFSGIAASVFKSKVMLVRDVGGPLHRPKSPDAQQDGNEPTELSMPTQFWAHVYGLEGERVGSAFLPNQNYMQRQSAPPTSAVPLDPKAPSQSVKKARKSTRPDKKRDKSRGLRVSTREPLALRKVHAAHDSEPSIDEDSGASREKGRTRERRGRAQVGNPSVAPERHGRILRSSVQTPLSTPSRDSTPAIFSDGSLTPLSELEVESNWL